ncbi:MAG: hypothetical protein AAFQ17_06880 [Pseudomonadota bacterium]
MKLHTPSGRAVAYLDGRAVYLGRYGTEEARRRYDRLICEWLANDRRLPEPARVITVDELADRYTAQHDPPELPRAAFKLVRELYGSEPITVLRPLALKALIHGWASKRLALRTVNGYAACVRHAIRWAVANELAEPEQLDALRAVPLLRAGKSEAVDPKRIEPVPWEDLAAIRPHVASAV